MRRKIFESARVPQAYLNESDYNLFQYDSQMWLGHDTNGSISRANDPLLPESKLSQGHTST